MDEKKNDLIAYKNIFSEEKRKFVANCRCLFAIGRVGQLPFVMYAFSNLSPYLLLSLLLLLLLVLLCFFFFVMYSHLKATLMSITLRYYNAMR